MTDSAATILAHTLEKMLRQRAYWISITHRLEREKEQTSDPHASALLDQRIEVLTRCTEDLHFITGRALRRLPLAEATAIRDLADQRSEERFRTRSAPVPAL